MEAYHWSVHCSGGGGAENPGNFTKSSLLRKECQDKECFVSSFQKRSAY